MTPFRPDVNVEERAARMLADCPFRDELYRVGVSRKFKFVAVWEFANALLERTQLGPSSSK